ncbi:type II toxin-antitoxin system HicA family toxin [Methanosarcina horonobensis]|uniref:type II toxin-antitoxin system HicA family toxin n=1 Tax=Methanosarcina horonobensis TaxID=418008 RepID=UPI00064E6AFE|nr:type II toxin-antitoxin system HicA family toxin [Methanosarcina horonobensis]
MSKLVPVDWRTFVKRLQELGFEGPYSGGKHPFMRKGDLVLTIPNPNKGTIGVDLLTRILKQARISREEWIGEDS